MSTSHTTLICGRRTIAAPAEVFTPTLLRRVFDVRADTLTNPLTGRLQLVYADDERTTRQEQAW